MKTHKNLLSKIAETDNLYTAYWKARKGKEAKREVAIYRENIDANIKKLQEQLISGDIEVGDYHYFTIYDPKERLICAAPFSQRVLHHAMMNICGPLFNRFQIPDSYASQIGKGTYAALNRARFFHKNFKWCIKIDIRKYFDNICHDVLKQQLQRFFKEKHLLRLMYKIIDSYDSGVQGRGLPIGNLTSQYFANHYLAVIDHYAYEDVKVSGYVRYMDDILVYGNDRNDLLDKAKKIRTEIENRLKVSLKVFNIRRTTQTMQFLGYRISDRNMQLSQRSKLRFKEKLANYNKKLNEEEWNEQEYSRHLQPLLSFVMKANSYNFRKSVLLRRVLTV